MTSLALGRGPAVPAACAQLIATSLQHELDVLPWRAAAKARPRTVNCEVGHLNFAVGASYAMKLYRQNGLALQRSNKFGEVLYGDPCLVKRLDKAEVWKFVKRNLPEDRNDSIPMTEINPALHYVFVIGIDGEQITESVVEGCVDKADVVVHRQSELNLPVPDWKVAGEQDCQDAAKSLHPCRPFARRHARPIEIETKLMHAMPPVAFPAQAKSMRRPKAWRNGLKANWAGLDDQAPRRAA